MMHNVVEISSFKGYFHGKLRQSSYGLTNFVLSADSMSLSMQASMKTEKQKKKEAYFPMRKFAVKA